MLRVPWVCIISYIFRRRQLKLPDDVIIEGTWTEGEHSDITFPVLLNRDTSCHLQHISSTACLYIPAVSVQVRFRISKLKTLGSQAILYSIVSGLGAAVPC
jgi:hypothetical protein